MAESRSRIVKCSAIKEDVNGDGKTPVWADDSFLLYDNGSFVDVETNTIDIVPLKEAYTPVNSLIGRQLQNFSGKNFLQGSGTAGTAPNYKALLTACALSETASAGSSVEYAPQSSSLNSSNIVSELDGIDYEMNGSMGSFTMSGSAAQGVEINWDLKGLYTAPTTAAAKSGFAAGANRAATLKSAALTIGTWDKDDTVGLVFKSFSFDRGASVTERSDANSSDGLKGLTIEGTSPTLELVVEATTIYNPGTAAMDLYALLKAGTAQAVTFVLDSGTSGNEVQFSFPLWQMTNIAVSDGEGGTRSWTISGKPTHTTDDADDGNEFLITYI
jgi:hypothetical protein